MYNGIKFRVKGSMSSVYTLVEEDHKNDFIVVPQTEGTLLLQTKVGESTKMLIPCSSYFKNAGIKHNAINAGDDEIVLLEIELKP